MKKLIGNKIGNVINLLIDGNTFQKTFANQDEANDFFKLMVKARTGDEAAYAQIMLELNRRYKTVVKGILERDNSDNYYLKGIDVVMPKQLGEMYLDYLENDFPVTALTNFWKLLVTNPDPRVREDLFEFLNQYNFAITDNGYFIAYKAVRTKEKPEFDLAAFVSNQYLKIKKWKKNPAHYEVVAFEKFESVEVENPDYDPDYEPDLDDDDDDIDYYSNQPEFITETKSTVELRLVKTGERNPDFGKEKSNFGNLAELFAGIDQLVDNRSVYESKHRGKDGRVEQVLGVPVKMARMETDLDPKVECSTGLHVGSTKYVKTFASNPDDVILLVLVNPAHVVAVPEYDNSKMRTCEYFPYAVLDRHANGEFEVIEEVPYFEESYMEYEKADLEKEIQRIQNEIVSKNMPDIQMTKDDYKKILQDRLIVIDSTK